MENKGFFQFEMIINVLGSSFKFIRIPMLWVYSHYKYFISVSVGDLWFVVVVIITKFCHHIEMTSF